MVATFAIRTRSIETHKIVAAPIERKERSEPKCVIDDLVAADHRRRCVVNRDAQDGRPLLRRVARSVKTVERGLRKANDDDVRGSAVGCDEVYGWRGFRCGRTAACRGGGDESRQRRDAQHVDVHGKGTICRLSAAPARAMTIEFCASSKSSCSTPRMLAIVS